MAAFPCCLRTDLAANRRAVQGGALYFALTFLAGTIFGTGRTLLLEPRLGAVPATLIELPIMLAACWLLCGWVVRRLAVPADRDRRLLMGGIAFALLLMAELVLAVLVSGMSAADHILAYQEPARLIGLTGQMLFAAFPLLRMRGQSVFEAGRITCRLGNHGK